MPPIQATNPFAKALRALANGSSKYILQEKKIKVLECSEMARFQIKNSAPDASADLFGDII